MRAWRGEEEEEEAAEAETETESGLEVQDFLKARKRRKLGARVRGL